MAKRQKNWSKDLKMYRHFAIVTVALTGGIAIMGDSAKREAVAKQADNVAVAVREVEAPKLTIKASGVSRQNGSSYSSSSGGYSGPFEFEARGLRSGTTPAWVKKLEALGITLEQFQAMSHEQQEALLRMINANVNPEDDERQIQSASFASLERSGGGEATDF